MHCCVDAALLIAFPILPALSSANPPANMAQFGNAKTASDGNGMRAHLMQRVPRKLEPTSIQLKPTDRH